MARARTARCVAFVACTVVFARFPPSLSGATVATAPEPVLASDEDRGHCEEVVSELRLRAGISRVVHHNARACRAEHVLHEVEPEATEAVSVGNHNLPDASCADAFQKGSKSSPPEIEPRPDILNEGLVSGERGPERVGLPREITTLVDGTDAGIKDTSSSRLRFLRRRRGGLTRGRDAGESEDVGEGIAPPPSSAAPATDAAISSPASECPGRHVYVGSPNCFGRHKHPMPRLGEG